MVAGVSPVLAVHGGAGAAPATPDVRALAESALLAALESGWGILLRGGRSLDAVQAAVASLERSGCFNAGRGAVPDRDGGVTLDAALMDGPSRSVGAVAAVAKLEAAIAGARLVMDETPHVFLVGPAADEFALSRGCSQPADDYFLRRRVPSNGTVGAVALDGAGHLAAATATGGIAGKMPGRVGDSPIVGAGTWADARCAVSATGTGEFFVRCAFAHHVAFDIARTNTPLDEATSRALAEVTSLGGEGGCVAVDRRGKVAMPFSTPAMYRGVVDATGSRIAVLANEALRPASPRVG